MVKRVAKLGTMGKFETIRRFQWRGEGELPASQGAISRATRILWRDKELNAFCI